MGHSRDTAYTRSTKKNNINITLPLQTLVMVIILIIAIVKQTVTQIKKIARKTVQTIQHTTKIASHKITTIRIKGFHKTITSAITKGMQKLNDEYNKSYQSLASRTRSDCDN